MKRQMMILTVLCTFLLIVSGCHSVFRLFSSNQSITVVQGDTLYSLSRKYHVDLQDLIDENNLDYPYTLSINQKLYLPRPKVHTVKKGETLYSISRDYETSIKALASANKLKSPYMLRINQQLMIAYDGDVVPNKTSTSASTAKRTAYLNNTSPVGKLKIEKTQQNKVVGTARKSSHVPWTQSRKRFLMPLKGKVISSFGTNNSGKLNDGINISAPIGTAIKAAESGTIGYADDGIKAYGNLVIIRHASGWMTAYAHANKLYVKKGQKVKKGQTIATVGQTGNVKSPQLHFEIRYKTKVVNPKNYLQ